MAVDRIDRQTDDLDAALVELRLDLGHVAEFGGAYRREVLRVGEQYGPGIADPVVEANLSSVVCASKSGAMSLIARVITHLPCVIRQST